MNTILNCIAIALALTAIFMCIADWIRRRYD
jgi:hypothetical protein